MFWLRPRPKISSLNFHSRGKRGGKRVESSRVAPVFILLESSKTWNLLTPSPVRVQIVLYQIFFFWILLCDPFPLRGFNYLKRGLEFRWVCVCVCVCPMLSPRRDLVIGRDKTTFFFSLLLPSSFEPSIHLGHGLQALGAICDWKTWLVNIARTKQEGSLHNIKKTSHLI